MQFNNIEALKKKKNNNIEAKKSKQHQNKGTHRLFLQSPFNDKMKQAD